ncbi:protein serine/threonine phosphatase 2C [Cylindrobasidium torrendii FP15055 ss-10]|uniref:Protein serine/threonine phosphatase 2C n=1 Tax=Cylindrobasidium torrendii FP15055 ss-10 TaxID=1314674 RepID=A0A0D7AZ37_9AGAR|nr:protein serine/threonine phosphatase 2C [Cylindrobasidium torrendii FP15055 ss-10]
MHHLPRYLHLFRVPAAAFAFSGLRLTDHDSFHGGSFSQSSRNVAPGVARFDMHITSRDSLGPRHMPASAVTLDDGRIWMVQALLDNHHGSSASNFLSGKIVAAALGGLADVFSRKPTEADSSGTVSEFRSIGDPTPVPEPSDETIQEEIIDSFLRLDDDLVNLSAMLTGSRTSRKPRNSSVLRPALSGSSAVVTIYETTVTGSRRLHIAQTGTARALLGRRKGHTFDVEIVGADVSQVTAQAREIEDAHAGESGLIRDNKLFGTFPLRAFGLGPLKWTADLRQRLAFDQDDDTWKGVQTGQYITAEPTVTSVTIGKGDVLVMASASLFGSMSDQEVLSVVSSSLADKGSESMKTAMPHFNLLTWNDDDDAEHSTEMEVLVSLLGGHSETASSNIAKALADKAAVKVGKDEALSIGVMVFD